MSSYQDLDKGLGYGHMEYENFIPGATLSQVEYSFTAAERDYQSYRGVISIHRVLYYSYKDFHFYSYAESEEATYRVLVIENSELIKENLREQTDGSLHDLTHIRFLFEMGPCFDFVCKSFDIEVAPKSP